MDRGRIPDPLKRFPPKRITVPVDFSDTSGAALAAALKLGKAWNAHIELVHVNEPVALDLTLVYDLSDGEGEEDRYYRHLQARVRDLAQGYSDVQVHVHDGYPKEVLAGLAEGGQSDLVVMGTHGRTALERFMLGSVAEAVVRASRSPVLTIPWPTGAGWPKRILVPMKQAEYADRALLYAAALADGLKAELTILHAAEGSADKNHSFRPLEEHLGVVLGRRRFNALGRIVTAGDPAEATLRAATREGFDLIVLAAHSKPFWESLILGTTAERILRHALVPVLSIPSIALPAPALNATPNGRAKAAAGPTAPWEEFL